MGNYGPLNSAIATGRTVEDLTAACKAKADQMIADRVIEVLPGCQETTCPAAHVARIHVTRGDVGKGRYKAILDSVVRVDGCLHEECICHPSFDKTHQPNADVVCPMEDSHYLPSPMAG